MDIFIIIAVLICCSLIYSGVERKKRNRIWIKDQYGKKPKETDCDFDKVGYYWSEFKDTVADGEKIDDVTWNDLEMDHIFSRINGCNSFVGEQVLFSTLHCLTKDNSYRELLEKKINFYANNAQERVDIQVQLDSLGKEDGSYLLPVFMKNLNMFKIPHILVYRIMQILLVVSVLPAVILLNFKYIYLAVVVFAINLVLYTLKKNEYELKLDTLKSVISLVKVGNRIANTKEFSYETKFQDLKKETVHFKKLSHMIGSLLRKSKGGLSGDLVGLIYDYLIGATLWDFVKYDQIIRILTVKQNEYIELYRRIGEIDLAITIASFRESLPLFCTPIFSEKPVLKMEELYHPMIDNPVYNTVTLERGCIITGSNASGKSTFIKAVAVNAILAQSINTCMAKYITLPYSSIITSMAVRDDLMTGESYYIKEIKYLNRIIQSLSEDRLVICAIDEILRGTNTEERIAASASILEFICKKNCIAIVASHDIELTQILANDYDNFHFQEYIQDNDIMFDYKINVGASTSKNAIRLLEYVGFPEEIIWNAREKLTLSN
ncbi:MAG: mismatch repair protein MutS domain protein [Clostridiales bacterium]|jgi:hypothetical protein|nr:mismatch repair protein MutS domain protein [Clostridiales bacterium]